MGRAAKSALADRAGERGSRIARARQRRLELDKDKEARDARIDHAVADVYLAQDERDDAVKVIEGAEVKMGEAIVRILTEGVPMAQVAELTELSVNQVQKLKAVPVEIAEAAAGAGTSAARATPVAPSETGTSGGPAGVSSASRVSGTAPAAS
jgi:hypothetical protein